MEKIKKSAIIGEYIIEISKNNSVKVYKIPKVAKAALRECAHKQGMEFSEEKETTQSLGWKLLKQYCEGANNGTIGEYHIERKDNGHIDVYVEHKNTIGALRDVAKLLKGFVWGDKWNTQDAGRKIVAYADQNPECILKKAPTKKQKDEQSGTSTSKAENPSVLTIEQCKEMAEVDYDELKNNCWEDEQGVKYSKDKKRLLGAPNEGIDGEYTVQPETLVICNDAFMQKGYDLINVILPEGLLYIGNNAFNDCGLESIDIPKSVIGIGRAAFMGCASLGSINVSESTMIDRFAFMGSPAYEEKSDVVESVIEATFKALDGKLADDTIDEMAEQIDEADRDMFTRLVAILDIDGEKRVICSELGELNEDLLRDLLEKVNDYCEDALEMSIDDVDCMVQYVSTVNEPDANVWQEDERIDGLCYAVKKDMEGDDFDGFESECYTYFDEVRYLLNVIFRITWANGEKQNLFVGMDEEVYDVNRIRFARAAEPYKQLIKEICAESVTVVKPAPAGSAIKNIVETTMKEYSDELYDSAIGNLQRKYNPDNEDTVLVATVEPDGVAKKMYFDRDPLWMLLEAARDEMEVYCDEEFDSTYPNVGFMVEWPTKIKLHRGNPDTSIIEANIIPYVINPSEEAETMYKEEEDREDYFDKMTNSLVRIHWSNGEVQDLFIDEDLKVHDFNTMDKSQLPECDRKSFDELIKG